jgi:hypothetical protein
MSKKPKNEEAAILTVRPRTVGPVSAHDQRGGFFSRPLFTAGFQIDSLPPAAYVPSAYKKPMFRTQGAKERT